MTPNYNTFWQGVVEESRNDLKLQGKATPEELKNRKDYCYQVRVRISDGMYANAGKDKQSGDQLPLARVISTGSGLNNIETPHYAKGDHVVGYWDGTTPVITGTSLFSLQYIPGIDPYGQSIELPTILSNYLFNGEYINYSGILQFTSQKDFSIDWDKNVNYFLPCPDEINDSTIPTTAIKNLIKEIQKIKNDISSYASTNILGKIQNIQNEVNKASQFISGWVSGKIKWLQEQIMKKINAAAATASNLLPLNARFPIRDGQNILIEALYCLFNKILDNLENFIADFLNTLIKQFVNVPTCIIEKFIQALLSQIVGLITSVLNAISGLIGSVTDLITGVIDTIIDLLEMFSCEPTPPCPDVKEWNILDGGKSGSSFDFGSILSSIESSIDKFSNIASTIYNPDTGEIIGIGVDDFSFDIGGIFNNTVSSCSGAPVLCGPPKISFFGGSGNGASGNVIVGLAGDILGVDIIDSGSGYTSAPYVTISDDCGTGRGVVAASRIGIVSTGNLGTGNTSGGNNVIGVIGVDIIEPGFGYLDTSDGSLGGDGRVWATPDQTIVVKNDNTYDTPYSPGDIINLAPGDTITYPDGTTVTIPGGTGTGDTGTGTGDTGTGTGDTGTGGTVIGGTGTGTGVTGTGTGVTGTGTGVTGTGTGVTGTGTGTGTGDTGTGTGVTVIGGTGVTVIGGTGDTGTGTGVTVIGGTGDTGTGTGTGGTGVTVIGGTGDTGTGTGTGGTGVTGTGTGVTVIGGTGGTGTGTGDISTGTGDTGTGDTSTGTGDTSTGTGDTGTGDIGTGTGDTVIGGTGTGGIGGIITVTAPKINKDNIKISRGFYPSSNTGQYPIFLTLCGIKVINRGGNYSPDDEITITPSNGAELSVTFNSKGMIDAVKVIKSGNGFIVRPKISIKSKTGFNAKIIPILCVNRIGDDTEILNQKVSQDKIIKVVDCVGKFV